MYVHEHRYMSIRMHVLQIDVHVLMCTCPSKDLMHVQYYVVIHSRHNYAMRQMGSFCLHQNSKASIIAF